MRDKKAMNTGSRLALQSALIGLSIAYFLMSWVSNDGYNGLFGLFWILNVDYFRNVFTGALVLIVAGVLLGRQAGLRIIVEHANPYWIGIKCGLLTLWTAALAGSMVGFFGEGLVQITNAGTFHNYLFKPMYWVTIFGMIPAILVGAWYGKRVQRSGQVNLKEW
jgi:hypothetical protein